jgi:hypothetical protein
MADSMAEFNISTINTRKTPERRNNISSNPLPTTIDKGIKTRASIASSLNAGSSQASFKPLHE